MIKGILFDFDGTIVDSEISRFESTNYVLEKYNVQISQEEWNLKYKSLGSVPIFEELKKKYNLDYNSEEIYSLAHKHRDSLEMKGIPVIKGFLEFYNKLLEKNIKMIICSGGTTEHLNKALKYANLPQIEGFGREHYNNRKPAPDAYLKGLQDLNLEKEEVLVFDDARTGIESAINAGCKVIGINVSDNIEDLELLAKYDDYTQIDIDKLFNA